MTIKKNMGPARAQPTRVRRPGRRYPSDLDDEEWAVLEPLLPPVRAGGRGRPAVHSRRAIVNAILYAGRAGCAWRYLPRDFLAHGLRLLRGLARRRHLAAGP